jgi:central kinetochore subunit Mal2/MCM21
LTSAASAHSLTNLHRLCASCTAFLVQDPDPNAIDSGRVLGVRIDVCLDGRFIAPYYILLNRISSSSQDLRIHKHTLPPCIPLAGLASKWLSAPPRVSKDGIQKPAARKQDLARLVKEVRREVVGYHRRLEAVNELRKALGFEVVASDSTQKSETRPGRYGLKRLEVADAEGCMLRLEWSDGKIGRIRTDKDGKVEKIVVVGDGRIRDVELTLMGPEGERKLKYLPERLRAIAEND